MSKFKLGTFWVLPCVMMALPAFAQDRETAEAMPMDMKHGTMSAETKSHPMSTMGMMEMGKGILVATTDGGVVVMVGNELHKYDQRLNLVNTVEIKAETKAVPKMGLGPREKGKLAPPEGDAAGHSTHHP